MEDVVVENSDKTADGVELGIQNSTDDNCVELPSEIGGVVVENSDKTALEDTEDTMIVENFSNEPLPSTESDKLVSNVESGVHCDSEIPAPIESEENSGEKGEALKDEIGIEVNPLIESHGSDENDNIVSDGGSSQTEVHMEIEKEEHGVEDEKPPSSKTNPSNGLDIAAEIDVGVCEMELDVPPANEVPEEKLIDGVSIEADTFSKTHITAEHDNIVSELEPRVHCDIEVVTDKHIDAVSNNANSSIAPDAVSNLGMETANAVCELKPDMSHDSEVAIGKMINELMSEVNTSSEPHISTETDNAVSKGEPEITRHSEVATEKLIDEVSSEANPTSEPHICAETDNAICKAEPGVPHNSEVATEKLIEEVSSEANPPSEPHVCDETDNAVCKAEPGIPHDNEGTAEKMIDGVSSEVNPSSSNAQHINAETENVVSEAEPQKMPCDSGVSKEKLVDELDSKINPSNDSHISAETDNVVNQVERDMPRNNEVEMETEADDNGEKGDALNGGVTSKTMFSISTDISEKGPKPKFYVGRKAGIKSVVPKPTFLLDPDAAEGIESGTEEEQAAFRKEVEKLYKEKYLEFKAPKFYREELNLLKLWRAVIKLGGYDKVTSCKLWRLVGESFNPPKTCTTVSWTFRIFYEKALLEFERDRLNGGQLPLLPVEPSRVENRADSSQTLGSGRALRDAAARAMQGWHSHRHLGNGEAGDAIIKEKHLSTMPKSDKQLRSSGLLKRKKSSLVDCDLQGSDMKAIKPRLDTVVFDIGPPADWVKINVKRFNDCFEVYGLVPGLLREEVHVQSDPAGRLIISGQPMQLDNPWGVTPFKKVVSLPSRIDPQQTSAVVTLNGQLFVRVPVEQSDF